MASLHDYLTLFGQEEEPEVIEENPVPQGATAALEELLRLSQSAPEDTFVARGDVIQRGDLPSEQSTGAYTKLLPGTADQAERRMVKDGQTRFEAFLDKGFSEQEAHALATHAIGEEERAAMANEGLKKDSFEEQSRQFDEKMARGEYQDAMKHMFQMLGHNEEKRKTDLAVDHKNRELELTSQELGAKYDDRDKDRKLEEMLKRLEIGSDEKRFDDKKKLGELQRLRELVGVQRLKALVDSGSEFPEMGAEVTPSTSPIPGLAPFLNQFFPSVKAAPSKSFKAVLGSNTRDSKALPEILARLKALRQGEIDSGQESVTPIEELIRQLDMGSF